MSGAGEDGRCYSRMDGTRCELRFGHYPLTVHRHGEMAWEWAQQDREPVDVRNGPPESPYK